MNNITLTSKCKALHFDVSQTKGEPLPQLVESLKGEVHEFDYLF